MHHGRFESQQVFGPLLERRVLKNREQPVSCKRLGWNEVRAAIGSGGLDGFIELAAKLRALEVGLELAQTGFLGAPISRGFVVVATVAGLAVADAA